MEKINKEEYQELVDLYQKIIDNLPLTRELYFLINNYKGLIEKETKDLENINERIKSLETLLLSVYKLIEIEKRTKLKSVRL